jgi:hypothetical protein
MPLGSRVAAQPKAMPYATCRLPDKALIAPFFLTPIFYLILFYRVLQLPAHRLRIKNNMTSNVFIDTEVILKAFPRKRGAS